ncbi:MAG: hypothetical protein U0R64_10585 [Candidatus Nanopelagicales bacterium]
MKRLPAFGTAVLVTLVAAATVPSGALATGGPTGVATATSTAKQATTLKWDFRMPASVHSNRDDRIAGDDPLKPIKGYPEADNVRWGPLPKKGRFDVTLTACSSTTDGAAKYRWQVTDAGITTKWSKSCDTTVRLTEGKHTVTAQLRDKSGTSSSTGRITVRNTLLVITGDSYSSGVGFPTLDGGSSPWLNAAGDNYNWDDPVCLRTRWGGFLRSAVALEQADPRSNVTVIDVACGGGQVTKPGGLLYPQNNGTGYRPAQIDQINSIIGKRRIDLLQLSIGGNDTGFGTVITTCATLFLVDPTADCWDAPVSKSKGMGVPHDKALSRVVRAVPLSPDDRANLLGGGSAPTLNTTIQHNLSTLPGRFSDLHRCFDGTGCKTFKLKGDEPAGRATASRALTIKPDNVLQMVYPNLIRNQDGNLCSDPTLAAPLNLADSQWAERGVIHFAKAKGKKSIKVGDQTVPWGPDGINTRLGLNGRQFGWTIDAGVYHDTDHNGLCSTEPAIYPLDAALNPFPQYHGTVPSFKWGVVHPNTLGQGIYAEHLTKASSRLVGHPVGKPKVRHSQHGLG